MASAFDPATERELERLRAQHGNVPEGEREPPPRRPEPPTHGAAAAAANELQELLREGTPAPPASMSAEDALRAGDADVAELRRKLDAAHEPKPAGKFAPSRTLGTPGNLSAHRPLAKDQSVSRFASVEADPASVWIMPADHPAAVEGRTLFPSNVVSTFDSARFLVSGHNNPKLGKEFKKGPWNGMPLFQVTLEERATCPRSCKQWLSCYGSAMHLARRNDHRDPDFLPALKAEVVTTARQFPKGFVVRLHTLGDFYSVEYLQLWADLLDALPNLYVFGYTARREDADDEESRRIARGIRWLTEQAWDRFAIRFSGHDGPQGSIVVTAPDARDTVVMCPAQTYATQACVTCGLCSSPEARHKTIAFLLHGAKKGRGRNAKDQAAAAAGFSEHAPAEDESALPASRADRPAPSSPRPPRNAERNAAWRARYEGGESIYDIAKSEPGISPGGVRAALIAAGTRIRTRQDAQRWRRGGKVLAIPPSPPEPPPEPAAAAPPEPLSKDRKETLRQKRIERAERIAAERLEGKSAAEIIAEQRARISASGRSS